MKSCKKIKLCIDCAHSKGRGQYMRCKKEMKIDLVTGRKEPRFCSTMRMYQCGEEGRFWEPKYEQPKRWWRFW